MCHLQGTNGGFSAETVPWVTPQGAQREKVLSAEDATVRKAIFQK